MVRLAHVSDLHLTSPKPSWTSRLLGPLRTSDMAARIKKAWRALHRARSGGADHVVVTGDLTETGAAPEYEVLAQTLAGSGFRPDQITLLPGNHDAYDSQNAWRDALDGPLAPWAEASARAPGHVVERGEMALLPLDTTLHQSVLRSGGQLDATRLDALRARIVDRLFVDRPVVIAMHHPPHALSSWLWQWWDGLRDVGALGARLAGVRPLTFLHGHVHRAGARKLGPHQVFAASATIEDEDEPRVALFDVDAAGLRPLAPA
jgi:3',5'-cyclic AMP phosphodiesterase CpdA